jgi:DNA replication protein DnaC
MRDDSIFRSQMIERCRTEPAEIVDLLTWPEATGKDPWPSDEEIARRQADREAQLAKEREEKAAQREKRVRGIAASIVPGRYFDTLVSPAFETTPAVQRVQRWLAADPSESILVLAGASGNGKSTAAALAVLETVRANPTERPAWIDAHAIPKAFGYDEDARTIWDCIINAPLLIVDDLGVGHTDARGWSLAAIDALISHRYADMRRVCITTNLNQKAFAKLVGERIVDRMREAGSYFLAPGASLRGKAR